MAIYDQETFGPITTVVRVSGVEEAVRVANDTEYGLAAAVFGRDTHRALQVAMRIDAGHVHVNGATVQNEAQAPYGGMKNSGYGRFDGRAVINEFTELKWITDRAAEAAISGVAVNTPLVLEELARQALEGDRDALDSLVRALQGDIYGLALQMLWNREDAEDATQEILVRVVTRLSQFGFRSRLKTWVYRLAVNYILDVKKSPIEQLPTSVSNASPTTLLKGASPRVRRTRSTPC